MKLSPRLIYPLLVSIAFFANACKEENHTYPTVEIRSPEKGKSYSYGDTIRVEALVKDRNGMVKASILQGSTVINFGQEKVIDKDGIVHFNLYYNERYLSSGSYDLRVSAWNGDNAGSDFVSIHLKELPRELKGIATLGTSGTESELSFYDLEHPPSIINLNGDHTSLAVNHRQAYIAVAPEFEGNLKGYDLLLRPQYNIPNPNLQGLRQYNDLESNGEFIYSFEEEGYIRAWHADGSQAHNYLLQSQLIPQTTVFGEPGMLLGAKERGKELYHLLLLKPDNGAIIKQATLSDKAHGMAYLGGGKYAVALFDEDQGSTLLMVYNTVNNTLTEFDEINGEAPTGLVALGSGEALLSTNQKIYRFNVAKPSLPVELYTFAAIDMEYDPLGGQVYFAVGSNVLSAAVGENPQQVFNAGHSIQEIELSYNK